MNCVAARLAVMHRRTMVNKDGTILADEWHYFTVSSDGVTTSVYLDGKLLDTFAETAEIFCADPSFGWEIGTGRKDGTSHYGVDAMNENSPEGMLRRLFCGAIAEVRVTEGALAEADMLYNKAN